MREPASITPNVIPARFRTGHPRPESSLACLISRDGDISGTAVTSTNVLYFLIENYGETFFGIDYAAPLAVNKM